MISTVPAATVLEEGRRGSAPCGWELQILMDERSYSIVSQPPSSQDRVYIFGNKDLNIINVYQRKYHSLETVSLMNRFGSVSNSPKSSLFTLGFSNKEEKVSIGFSGAKIFFSPLPPLPPSPFSFYTVKGRQPILQIKGDVLCLSNEQCRFQIARRIFYLLTVKILYAPEAHIMYPTVVS
jgi:hypothetical protein